jgi:hypothetical protein
MQSTLVIAPNFPTAPKAAQATLGKILAPDQVVPPNWWWQFFGLQEKLTIDLVRELAQRVLQTGGETGLILVLANFTQASITVQNALLKLLEEPPMSVWFILVAASAKGVLPTIQSRCRLCYCPQSKPDSSKNELLPLLLAAKNKTGSQLAHELVAILKQKVSAQKKIIPAPTETQVAETLLHDLISALTDRLPQLQNPAELTVGAKLIQVADAALTRLRANVSAKNSLFYLALAATMI